MKIFKECFLVNPGHFICKGLSTAEVISLLNQMIGLQEGIISRTFYEIHIISYDNWEHKDKVKPEEKEFILVNPINMVYSLEEE